MLITRQNHKVINIFRPISPIGPIGPISPIGPIIPKKVETS